MVEAFLAWVLLITGIFADNTDLIVASGVFAIAAQMFFNRKGGDQ